MNTVVTGEDTTRPQAGVTLDNWQTAPQLPWSFQHIEDLFPTAVIDRGSGPVATLGPAATLGSAWSPASDVTALPVAQPDGSVTSVGAIMAATDTDGWIVTHDGAVLAESYPLGMPADTRHLLMSVSKSLVGAVAGALVDGGALDPEEELTAYVPALAESGYAGATVRNLLDMRSGIRFGEDYLDPTAEVRVLEQAIGWAPRAHPLVPRTMFDYLLTLRAKGPHGGPFEYRSGETDVLGWVCEAAGGSRMPRLMSDLLWSRLGAEEDAVIGVDSAGSGMFDGGICTTLRDLVRFGSIFVGDGASMTGAQVLSSAWVADTLAGGPDSRAAFAASPSETLMPGGMYRNQLWFPYPGSTVLLCLGIHGQMIYVNRAARVVAAKLSSWPEPQHAWKLFSTLRAFDAVAAQFV